MRFSSRKDLNDWRQIEQAKWVVKAGLLHGSGQQGCLLSKAAYDDFELALSYRLSRGAIGGIVLQASRKGNLSEFWKFNSSKTPR